MPPSSAPHSRPVDAVLRLGLIGDNILESRSPALHRLAGRMEGFEVSYELLVPARLGKDFDAVFDDCRGSAMRGINVTYPYKERVLGRIRVGDPFLRTLGSVNTVVFEPDGPVGYNTDYSGFIAAYRDRFGGDDPGRVAIIGAGGVGRAISFALATLGASALHIVDRDATKAAGLARALTAAFGERLGIGVFNDVGSAMDGVTGVVNCTPVGMSGHPGSAVPKAALTGCKWAFDSVYTPVETEFKADCEAAGVAFLSGYELFFHQGIDAFRIFSGRAIGDLGRLRTYLSDASC